MDEDEAGHSNGTGFLTSCECARCLGRNSAAMGSLLELVSFSDRGSDNVVDEQAGFTGEESFEGKRPCRANDSPSEEVAEDVSEVKEVDVLLDEESEHGDFRF